jgi:16S rRNA (adenine1518-N6/adenine1519-N6)-dimethyltransferase
MKRDELKRLLEAAGIQPRRPLGQNFLTDPNLLRAIARDAEIEPTDVVLEVGAGTAGLTVLLCESAAHVVTVEIDPALADLARDRLALATNVTLIERDVLAQKSRISDEVLETVKRELAARPGSKLRVVANLPYAIATPVVVHLLELDLPLARMTVMVQTESAERFAARPGDPVFNSVSVLVAQLADVKVLRKIPKDVFFPKPKISSAVVQLDPRPERGVRDPLYPALKTIARALFNYRRKTLATAAKSAAKQHPPLAVVEAALARAGISGERRAEHLQPEEWRTLAKECAPALAGVEIDLGDEHEAEPVEKGERRKHRNKYADKSQAPEVEPEIPDDDEGL